MAFFSWIINFKFPVLLCERGKTSVAWIAILRINMKNNLYKTTFIWFVFCSVLLSVSAYAAGGKLRVECLDETGKPLKGVRVEALSLSGGEPKDKKSNGDIFYTKFTFR